MAAVLVIVIIIILIIDGPLFDVFVLIALPASGIMFPFSLCIQPATPYDVLSIFRIVTVCYHHVIVPSV